MRTLTLCLTCADLLRRAYKVQRLAGRPGNGKCDQCKKRNFVTKYEVRR